MSASKRHRDFAFVLVAIIGAVALLAVVLVASGQQQRESEIQSTEFNRTVDYCMLWSIDNKTPSFFTNCLQGTKAQ